MTQQIYCGEDNRPEIAAYGSTSAVVASLETPGASNSAEGHMDPLAANARTIVEVEDNHTEIEVNGRTSAVVASPETPGASNSAEGHMDPLAANAKNIVEVYADALHRLADS